MVFTFTRGWKWDDPQGMALNLGLVRATNWCSQPHERLQQMMDIWGCFLRYDETLNDTKIIQTWSVTLVKQTYSFRGNAISKKKPEMWILWLQDGFQLWNSNNWRTCFFWKKIVDSSGPPGMSGVQGGLGEQKRDILKIREEALERLGGSGTPRFFFSYPAGK